LQHREIANLSWNLSSYIIIIDFYFSNRSISIARNIVPLTTVGAIRGTRRLSPDQLQFFKSN